MLSTKKRHIMYMQNIKIQFSIKFTNNLLNTNGLFMDIKT